jgi:hypothetical protein
VDIGIFNRCGQRDASQTPSRIVAEVREPVCAAQQAGLGPACFAEDPVCNYSLMASPLMMVTHCDGVVHGYPGEDPTTDEAGIQPLYGPERAL